MEEELTISPSLKNKLKQTLYYSSCCFHTNYLEALKSRSWSSSSSSSSSDKSSIVRASSIGDKWRNIFSRMGKHHHRRQSPSAEFRYDPLSYALNFEDVYNDAVLDEAPLKNFSSRLRSSPSSEIVVSRRIAALS